MEPKALKDDRNYTWTLHSKFKLFQYNLSPSLIKRVARFPDRVEEGIAPNTIAVMKRKDKKDKNQTKQELWVMYQKLGRKKKIISAWIYPGESPKGKEIFIPEDTLEELYKEQAQKETAAVEGENNFNQTEE